MLLLEKEPLAENDDFGVSAEEFDVLAWLTPKPVDASASLGEPVQSQSSGTASAPQTHFRQDLHHKAKTTEAMFQRKVSRETLGRGAAMASSILGMIGQMAASCGPLCLHALAGAGQALGGGGVLGAGLGGFSQGSEKAVQTLGEHLSKSGIQHPSVPQLQRTGRLSESEWNELSSILGVGLSVIFGFGLVDTLVGALLPSGRPAVISGAQAA